MDFKRIVGGRSGVVTESTISPDRHRPPSPNPVFVDGELETHHPCRCLPFSRLELIRKGTPPKLGLPPPRFSRRCPARQSTLGQPSQLPSFGDLTFGRSEDIEPHPPIGQPSQLPSSGDSTFGKGEDIEPHPPTDQYSQPSSFGDWVTGTREDSEPHLPTDSDLLFPSPRNLTAGWSENVESFYPLINWDPLFLPPLGISVANASEILPPYSPVAASLSPPFLEDRAIKERGDVGSCPVATRPDEWTKQEAVSDKSPEPTTVLSIETGPRKSRRTRRAGRKNQLRRLVKLYKSGGAYHFPESSPATKTDRSPRDGPIRHGPDRQKPRIKSIEKVQLPIKLVSRTPWALHKLDLGPVIYPASVPKTDPRYERYMLKRAQALYPLPALEVTTAKAHPSV